MVVSLEKLTASARMTTYGRVHATVFSNVLVIELSSQHTGHVEVFPGCATYRKHFGTHRVGYEREVAARGLLATNPASRHVASAILIEDVEVGELCVAFLESVVTLRQMCTDRSPAFQSALAQLANALAAVHRTGVDVGAPALQPSERPFAFGLSEPTVRLLQVASLGSVELAKILQLDASVRDELNCLASTWEPTAFIHSDLKWDNILVHPREGETKSAQIKITDWELAGIGDPCWDVGTVLGEYLAFWALSIPIVSDEAPDTYMHLAQYPLESLQPAISAFWQSYSAGMGFDETSAREQLIRSTRYAGARLIQTAYERTQTMSRLTPQIYLLLQLSLNVLDQPESAAEQLLGLTC
jgi:aminoglycoside phosphotransferase (APT) family kinase protein